MRLRATSKTKFTISKSTTPSKKKRFKVRITSSKAPIRVKAGYINGECDFSPLAKDAVVYVCDSIKSSSGSTWYYIYYKGKYGYIYNGRVVDISNSGKFLKRLERYHGYIKDHYRKFAYEYDSKIKTFTIAKNAIDKGETVHITCVSPSRWGFHALGIRRTNGDSLIYGEDGHFKHFEGNANEYLKLIKSGGPVGKTWEKAIDDGDLIGGDVVAFEDTTHTSTFSGVGYIFYDSGRDIMRASDLKTAGIKVDYKKKKKYVNRKINEVLRWR